MAEQVSVKHSIQVRVLTGEPRIKHTSCMQKSLIKKMRQKMYATIHAPVVERYTQQT